MSSKTSSTLVLTVGGYTTGAEAAGCWLNAGGQTRAPIVRNPIAKLQCFIFGTSRIFRRRG